MAEPQPAQLVHAVAVQPGLQHIGDQHGVVERRDADSVARQHPQVIFGVLRHLEHRRVFQQRLQPGDDLIQRNLLDRLRGLEGQAAVALGLVADGDVAGLARRHGQGDSHQMGRGGGQGVGLGVEGHQAPVAGPGDPGVQPIEVAHADIAVHVDRRGARFGARRLGRERRSQHRGRGHGGRAAGRGAGHMAGGADAPGQGRELHQGQETAQGLGVRVLGPQGLDRLGQGRVAVQPHQFARQPDLVGEIDQGLAALVLLDLARAGQERVEIAVFVDQQGRGLDADARRAGHIVDAVAAQGLDVDHLVRPHAELLIYLLGADAQVLHGVEHRHPLAHQLHQVLVGGDDHRLPAQVAHLAGIGGDQVVGLVAGQLDGRHAEGPRGVAHQGELRHQVLGRRRAVGLVEVVEGVAERLLRMVEDHRQVGGRVRIALHVAKQLPHHVAEARHRPHRQAVRLARQRRQGVVGAEDVGRAVDEIEAHAGAVLGEGARLGRGGGRVEGVGHGAKIGAQILKVTRPLPRSGEGNHEVMEGACGQRGA